MNPLLRWLLPLLLLAWQAPAGAHDVAGELRVAAFVRAEPGRAVLVLRLPLELLLNVDLPKHGSGYLDLTNIDSAVPRVLKAAEKGIELFADGERLVASGGTGRIATPADKSFRSYAQALAAVRDSRLPADAQVYWNQGYFDAVLEYPLARADATLALDFHVSPGLRERLKMDLRHVRADDSVRAFEIVTGSGQVPLDPRWYQAAGTFTESGVRHIFGGLDHLLFLLCLIVPFCQRGGLGWPLVGVVTAFTVAHSITLIAAAYGLMPSGNWFAPLVEVLIAVSILYMAVENVIQPNLRWRWLITGAFGLVHGFGFSFSLANELQFAGSHLVLSLLAFNVGIEIGQLLFIALAWPVMVWLLARAGNHRRVVTAVLSALVGHAAWHWLGQRLEALQQADAPVLDAPLLARAAVLALVALAALLLVKAWRRPARGGRRRLNSKSGVGSAPNGRQCGPLPNHCR